MMWVEETKYSLILVTSLHQDDMWGSYGVSFIINTGIWLVSLNYLKHIDNDEICDRKCGGRRPKSGTSASHHQTGRRNAKDDMPRSHDKSPREIHACRPTS